MPDLLYPKHWLNDESQPGHGKDLDMIDAMQNESIGGRYKLIQRIGRGGQGEVWLAHRNSLGGFTKQVVVKLINLTESNDKQRASLLREASLAAQLRHPNIVDVQDVDQHNDKLLFLVMEYIQGLNLYQLLKQHQQQMGHPLPWDLAAYVIAEVCRGLDYVRQIQGPDGLPAGIVHRDLKPSNIILSLQGQVKIIDFGLAKAATSHITETGECKGTPAYMSPEQFRAEHTNHRSDLFSLGVVFHELCSGKLLFGRENLYATFHALTAGHVPSLREFSPDIPQEIDQLIQSMLQQEQEMRPRDAREVQFTIEQVIRKYNAPVSADDLATLLDELLEQELDAVPFLPSPVSNIPTAEPPPKPTQNLRGIENLAAQTSQRPDTPELISTIPRSAFPQTVEIQPERHKSTTNHTDPSNHRQQPKSTLKSPLFLLTFGGFCLVALGLFLTLEQDKTRALTHQHKPKVALRIQPSTLKKTPHPGGMLHIQLSIACWAVLRNISYPSPVLVWKKPRRIQKQIERLPPGRYELSLFNRKNFIKQKIKFQIWPGQSQRIRRKFVFGTLEVGPSLHASVWLKGFGKLGSAGKRYTLPIGKHTIFVRNKQKIQSFSITLQAGELRQVLPK